MNASHLPHASTGSATHGDAMRPTGQTHDQGREGQGSLHLNDF